MKQSFKSENELRVYNLRQFVKDVYQGEFKEFNNVFKQHLKNKYKFTEDQIETKSSQIRQAFNGQRNFTEKQQKFVEKAFSLPTNVFTRIRPCRKTAYIFVSCMGNSSELLYSYLKEHELVDEVSILFGDIDLFVRVYGSLEEIQNFINQDIYSDERISISNTRTYFSLHNKNWSKYPVNKHSEYIPPLSRWV